MEDDKFFVLNSMDVDGTNRAKEKNPDSEDGNISLELSLSSASTMSTDMEKQEINYEKLEPTMIDFFKDSQLESRYTNAELSLRSFCSIDNMSIRITPIDKEKLPMQDIRKSDARNMMCMEDSRSAFSSELMEGYSSDNVPLELSLSLSFGVGECSYHHNLNSLNKTINGELPLTLFNKRQTIENPEFPTGRNKRNRVEIEIERRHHAPDDPWCIKKQLYNSDLGNLSRLILPSELVESHVLPHWNADQLAQIQQGLPVFVWDCDTNTQHYMKFKRWGKGANVLIKNWTTDFVKRRNLKLGDEIGLYWDIHNSRFNFSVLNRASSE
ncbi:hypothetical protein Goarm_015124 [Gossypium armourianum]|uniref:Uncharacterized protein n=1 Tax=Gossypium armourianum TaxID=34283 RepID=A0A7J9J871_9ROSI|nr:hypothetical protein [Gossypium armourianum]